MSVIHSRVSPVFRSRFIHVFAYLLDNNLRLFHQSLSLVTHMHTVYHKTLLIYQSGQRLTNEWVIKLIHFSLPHLCCSAVTHMTCNKETDQSVYMVKLESCIIIFMPKTLFYYLKQSNCISVLFPACTQYYNTVFAQCLSIRGQRRDSPSQSNVGADGVSDCLLCMLSVSPLCTCIIPLHFLLMLRLSLCALLFQSAEGKRLTHSRKQNSKLLTT